MLKGLPPAMTPELLYALAAMGHGDTIAIVDRNFPADAYGRRVIRLPGLDLAEAARMILSLLPVDDFVLSPISVMVPVDDAEATPAVQREFLAEAERAEGRSLGVERLSRHRFYRRSEKAFAIVATSEDRAYGCVLVKKGVIRASD